MQRTYRLVPPPVTSGYNPITINGRVYRSVGAAVDMPAQDADTARQSGWLDLGMVGSTAERPTQQCPDMKGAGLQRGQRFIDTSVGAVLVFDARNATWRHGVTGEVVS